MSQLERHPKIGASWEGLLLESVAQHLRLRPEQCHFWATHQGAELDLLVVRGRRKLGFEFKRSSAPTTTTSMHIALADLGLSSLHVVHAGAKSYPMASRLRAVALRDLDAEVRPLK